MRATGKEYYKRLLDENGNPIATRKEAIRIAANTEMNIPGSAAEEAVTLDNIWETFLKSPTRPDSGESTLKIYNQALRRFQKWYREQHKVKKGSTPLAKDVTEKDANAFFSFIWDTEHLSGRTFNAYLQALKLIFKHILAECELAVNPFDKLTGRRQCTVRHQAFTEEQVNNIFKGFDEGFFQEREFQGFGPGRVRQKYVKRLQYIPPFAEEMRVLLLLCCWTGCRGQDGCLMTWKNIDLKKGEITYVPHKTAEATGHEAVSLPMHPALREGLEDAKRFRTLNKKGEDYIIPNVADRYNRNPSGISDTIQHIIQCALGKNTTAEERQAHQAHRSNIYGMHSFRHTFVSFCANRGVPLEVVAAIVGHTSTEMTRHYAHISTEAKRDAIGKLSEAAPKTNDQLLARFMNMPQEKQELLLKFLA
ncbi:MAG: tyrosine-type recombinase/integrase [Victivallaceae bacterium]|nr:tyrosine-type recombinase/integrase [Victivallaceae bacterium]